MPLKPHPTDLDKMVYVSSKYAFDPDEWRQHASEYEQGFLDGMQKQMQSSVDKAVNAMGKREWVGLTDEDIDGLHEEIKVRLMGTFNTKDIYRAVEAKLKERNT